ncbi:MAG: type II toxin-antitoxin system RelE/ParE family toxin [Candidatus Wallbacteria bacterium]|nr:type II toxin-antitoxin system RelE/ParE family toxin [Candidatus Wallbacteria bacterium]
MGDRRRLDLREAAERVLDGFEPKLYRQVMRRVLSLREVPEPASSEQLKNTRQDGHAVRRERSGDYRILYYVTADTVVVLEIGDRKDVYR